MAYYVSDPEFINDDVPRRHEFIIEENKNKTINRKTPQLLFAQIRRLVGTILVHVTLVKNINNVMVS